MIRVCFVCLGNICRSPMAEYILNDIVKKKGISSNFIISSRGTSYEEMGNDLYPPAKEELRKNHISFDKHHATRLEKDDYEKYDYFLCMEKINISSARNIMGDSDNKISLLLDRDISDPWYTGDFENTYLDLVEGINLFLEKVKNS